MGEQNRKDFLILFGNILRLRNILSAFDLFVGNELLSPADFQDYTGTYHDVYDEMKTGKGTKDSILDDVVFELELVKQVEVNIDYILMLVAKYHDSNCKDKEILGAKMCIRDSHICKYFCYRLPVMRQRTATRLRVSGLPCLPCLSCF